MRDEGKFVFQKEFETGNTIFYNLGRLSLGDGSIVRLYFSPEGLLMIVPQSAIDSGHVKIWKDQEGQLIFETKGTTP